MTVETARSGITYSPGSEFLRGMRRAVPVIIATLPFAILFGVLAVDSGLTVFETVLMSATIFAGASQLVGLNLFGHHVAPWIIVLSIFAVNFRHVLYSAAVGRHMEGWSPFRKAVGFFFLVDPQFAESERRALEKKPVTFAWYMGMGLPLYAFWVFDSWLGAAFGSYIPDTRSLGIEFLLPIYFLGLLMEFRGRPLFLPVVVTGAVAAIVAHETVGSPWHVTIGALAGILVAVVMPPKQEKGRS